MKIVAKVLTAQEIEFKDGSKGISLALIIQGRKVWANHDDKLIKLSADKSTAELETNDFEVDPMANAKGSFIKLMPKFTIGISQIAQVRARVSLQVAEGVA